ncbi:MAG TPA: YHS domain-containing protein [Gemmataceae bacterium]|nr:YHS domain-containing protein [Gemmataceae bacterium]
MKRTLAYAAAFGLLAAGLAYSAGPKEDAAASKEALQALNEFIGQWKGTGDKEKARPGSKTFWSEKASWGWRFKGDDAWLVLTIDNGKLFKGGELRYLPAKKKYQLTLTDRDDHKLVFEGEVKDGKLTAERTDPKAKEVQQVTMSTAAEGDRFIYYYKTRPEGRKLFNLGYMVASTRDGASFARKDKGKECVVSGGLGTIAVTYKGETFYVCCTGCRDAFNENPEKYVKEFKARKK